MSKTKKYRPSNGTEGTAFIETYCMNCVFCDPNPEGERQCETLAASMAFDLKDDEYPSEWTFDKQENPICTKHKFHDWVNNGEPELPVNDPNQTKLFE